MPGAEQGSGKIPRIVYTRKTRQECLDENLEALAARRQARARMSDDERTATRTKRMLTVGLVLSLALSGAMAATAAEVSRHHGRQALVLRGQIADVRARLAGVAAPAPQDAPAPTNAPTDGFAQALDAARADAETAARIQNELAAVTARSSFNPDKDDYDSLTAAAAETLDVSRREMAGLFDPAALKLDDGRAYGAWPMWLSASSEGDPRLVWAPASFGADGGCVWRVGAVSARSLVDGSGPGVAALWLCDGADGRPRAWARAVHLGVFNEFETMAIGVSR